MSDMKKDILELVQKHHSFDKKFTPGDSPVPVSGKVYDQTYVPLRIFNRFK